MLEVGSEAAGFTVADQDEQRFTLADQRGRWTLLWWYPKASTPG